MKRTKVNPCHPLTLIPPLPVATLMKNDNQTRRIQSRHLKSLARRLNRSRLWSTRARKQWLSKHLIVASPTKARKVTQRAARKLTLSV